jgi:hypothetical protein
MTKSAGLSITIHASRADMLGPHPRRVWRPNGAVILVTPKYINAATRYIPQSANLNTTSDPSSPSCCSCDNNPCSILPSSIITPRSKRASERQQTICPLLQASASRIVVKSLPATSLLQLFFVSRSLYQPVSLLAKFRQKRKTIENQNEFAGFNRQK